ncbi:hypothetical protein C8A00DRAFT_16038 [Chaetomidium leptoderma]|uniref:Uncharacterized protein n=1 Tax=Chaetomidium leptoderma TaxID=669021 RepID=A0AAN6VK95_9PEZI|nr:hypothetical protein C8A00DRAFT_16038 [Chaetomidium leptoderma]
MDFSQPSAAASCSALSGTAQSTTAKIQELISAGAVAEDTLGRQLSFLSSRVQQFRQHVDQLGHCIADASVVHPQLGDVLKSSLAECQNALGTVSNKLEPGSGGLSADAIACDQTLMAAYLRLFVLATQLLIMETGQEQQSKLANPASRAIVDTAHEASLRVLSFNYVTEN